LPFFSSYPPINSSVDNSAKSIKVLIFFSPSVTNIPGVSPLKFIRRDRKFNNSAQLIRQMNKDIIFATKGLKTKLVL